jgi:hypothetical protein
VLLVVSYSNAQETYNVNVSANQVVRLTTSINMANASICLGANLPIGCTQAQLCIARNVPGGASCTAGQARNAFARIYPITQAGREEFLIYYLILPSFRSLDAEDFGFDGKIFCMAWPVLSQSVKDNICTTAGLAAGCNPCIK